MDYPSEQEQRDIASRRQFWRPPRLWMTDAEASRVISLGHRALRCFPMGSLVQGDAEYRLLDATRAFRRCIRPAVRALSNMGRGFVIAARQCLSMGSLVELERDGK